MYKKVQTNQVKLLIKSLNYWSPKTIKKVLGNKFHVVPNYAISGQLGLERCDGALSQKTTVSKSPNNISDKNRSLCCFHCWAPSGLRLLRFGTNVSIALPNYFAKTKSEHDPSLWMFVFILWTWIMSEPFKIKRTADKYPRFPCGRWQLPPSYHDPNLKLLSGCGSDAGACASMVRRPHPSQHNHQLEIQQNSPCI